MITGNSPPLINSVRFSLQFGFHIKQSNATNTNSIDFFRHKQHYSFGSTICEYLGWWIRWILNTTLFELCQGGTWPSPSSNDQLQLQINAAVFDLTNQAKSSQTKMNNNEQPMEQLQLISGRTTRLEYLFQTQTEQSLLDLETLLTSWGLVELCDWFECMWCVLLFNSTDLSRSLFSRAKICLKLEIRRGNVLRGHSVFLKSVVFAIARPTVSD